MKNYFYLDEHGSVSNNSELFIIGCIKTKTPDAIKNAVEKLKSFLISDLYYKPNTSSLKTEGFHATKDHFDTRAQFYRILPFLEYRSYFSVLIKKGNYYKQFSSKYPKPIQIKLVIKRLIEPLIQKHKEDDNLFIFEEVNIPEVTYKSLLIDLFDELNHKHKTSCKVEIRSKDETNLAVIDYLNFNLSQVLTKHLPRDVQNYNVLKERIGMIAIMNNGKFLSRKSNNNVLLQPKAIKDLVSS